MGNLPSVKREQMQSFKKRWMKYIQLKLDNLKGIRDFVFINDALMQYGRLWDGRVARQEEINLQSGEEKTEETINKQHNKMVVGVFGHLCVKLRTCSTGCWREGMNQTKCKGPRLTRQLGRRQREKNRSTLSFLPSLSNLIRLVRR